jgi:hypothetical protein
MMSIVQEYRLKTKRGMAGALRLPSLEYLHSLGRGCLVVSTIAIACGLVSGVVLNFQRNGSVNWLESGIVFSGGLLVWLVIASILEWRASLRATSWAAYLNIASFLIVFIALILVFAAPHGRTHPENLPTYIPFPLAPPVSAMAAKWQWQAPPGLSDQWMLARLNEKLACRSITIASLASTFRAINSELRVFA